MFVTISLLSVAHMVRAGEAFSFCGNLKDTSAASLHHSPNRCQCPAVFLCECSFMVQSDRLHWSCWWNKKMCSNHHNTLAFSISSQPWHLRHWHWVTLHHCCWAEFRCRFWSHKLNPPRRRYSVHKLKYEWREFEMSKKKTINWSRIDCDNLSLKTKMDTEIWNVP